MQKPFAKTKRKIPPVLFENNIREGFKISRVYAIRAMMYVAYKSQSIYQLQSVFIYIFESQNFACIMSDES